MANVASFDPQFLNIPIRTLFVGDAVFPVVVREATITRAANKHDQITMSVVVQGDLTVEGNLRIPLDGKDPISGTRDVLVDSLAAQPVTFTYGIAPSTEQFYGYVLSITPDQKFKQGLNYVITMVGTTQGMQQVHRRFYTNVTTSDFIRRCASRARLGLFGNTSTYRWPSLAITKETDWTMIQAMASLMGCVVFNYSGVILIQDPTALFKRFPYTTLVSSDDLLESDRKLLDFKPTEDSIRQVAKMPKEFYYFDDNGRVVSYKQPAPAGVDTWTPYSDSPVRNRQEAELLGRSSANSTERWLHHATARIRGDSAIHPGVTVDVNTGTRSATAKFNGRWLVMGVKHSMNREAYNTELTLARPGNTIPALASSSFEYFWRSSPRPKPAMYLRNGLWVSSWAETALETAV